MPGFSRRMLTLIALTVLAATAIAAQEQGDVGYVPSKENLAAREWFRDAGFGLFIHWGVYSVPGRGEWVMNNEKIPITEYEKIPPRFNPVKFDPDAWCRMAKDAGMKYITITSKHHDGFAMFDSKTSAYDIVERTPYGKDVLRMLAEACERNGLKLFFYHSQLDWHHPDYFPRGRTGQGFTGRPENGDWNTYLDYMDSQLAELCTNYGKIGGIWFDGMWDKPEADWRLGKTFKLIHSLQPQALIGNNHHRAPYPGEDFQMFEKGLPGADPFSRDKSVSALPLETCETINGAWGYNASDTNYKSVKDLVRYLVRASGMNTNFLLNIGPMPDGTIQPVFVERLAGMGKWLRANGESVYGTRGGPVPPQSWGVTTQKGNTVYVHILSETDRAVAVPDFGKIIVSARLIGGAKIEFSSSKLGTLISLPGTGRDDIDTVVVLTVK